MNKTIIKKDSTGTRLLIERKFDAPIELVWKAWTDPEILDKWWAPKPWKAETKFMDFREGGYWLYVMVGPEDEKHWGRADFISINPLKEFISYDGFCDSEGNLNEELPRNKWEIRFYEKSGKTLVEVELIFESSEDLEKIVEMGFKEGFSAAHDNLDELLRSEEIKNSTPLIIEREFDAPINLVWEAITDKDHIKNWFFELEDFKPEVGFEFQFVGQGNSGEKYVHICKITEVTPFKKLQYSWEYENYEGRSLVTFKLYEEGDKTKVRLTHEGLETFPVRPDFAPKNYSKGWTELFGKQLENYVKDLNNNMIKEKG